MGYNSRHSQNIPETLGNSAFLFSLYAAVGSVAGWGRRRFSRPLHWSGAAMRDHLHKSCACNPPSASVRRSPRVALAAVFALLTVGAADAADAPPTMTIPGKFAVTPTGA